ncbi:hypothetical protein Rhopal_000667-T1 [Rhodotorula paludigena]|uniref:UFSP1/2/DUB catalytic domain-containing protein n=1 Tax=Rhodotorula paludigena TaxID=86838 RepID=A0AAV5GF76_9BASI|nr:hypothetical protein Rhopal_000667-T1 [Rhodotorula paludigena]
MQCLVCSAPLHGDALFVEAHINRSAAADNDRFEQDRMLALALAREQEQDQQYGAGPRGDKGKATAAFFPQSESPAGLDDLDGASCPCCGAIWEDYNLGLRAPGPSAGSSSGASSALPDPLRRDRTKHVAACSAERGRFALEMGEHGMPDFEEEGGGGGGAGQGLLSGKGKRSWTGDVGGKDEVKGTPGLVHVLHRALNQSHSSPHGRTSRAFLARPDTEHVATRVKDWGWGCGYKNAQMIFSSLRHLPQYRSHFAASRSPDDPNGGAKNNLPLAPIPTILEWQEMIEKAWKAGYDPEGAAHFGGKLVGSRRWIGTTEIYVALTWMGVRASIVDFPKGTGSGSVNEALLRWVKAYFSEIPSTAPSSSSTAPNAFSALLSSAQAGGAVRLAPKQPLYLQHRGHSRTIVGVEIGGGGSGGGARGAAAVKQGGRKMVPGGQQQKEDEEAWLLVFDPGKPIPNDFKTAGAALASSAHSAAAPTPFASSSTSPFPLGPLTKKHKSCSPPAPAPASTSAVSPVPARGGFGGSSKTAAGPTVGGGTGKFGDTLKVFRVNMRELRKKDQYQILYVPEGEPPLSPQEKQARKFVKSLTVTT